MIVFVGEWAERGACRAAIAAGEATQDDWYPERWGDASKALRICKGCPVRQECLDHAITHNERHGIWGGVGPKHRRQGTRVTECRGCGVEFSYKAYPGRPVFCSPDCPGVTPKQRYNLLRRAVRFAGAR